MKIETCLDDTAFIKGKAHPNGSLCLLFVINHLIILQVLAICFPLMVELIAFFLLFLSFIVLVKLYFIITEPAMLGAYISNLKRHEVDICFYKSLLPWKTCKYHSLPYKSTTLTHSVVKVSVPFNCSLLKQKEWYTL